MVVVAMWFTENSNNSLVTCKDKNSMIKTLCMHTLWYSGMHDIE